MPPPFHFTLNIASTPVTLPPFLPIAQLTNQPTTLHARRSCRAATCCTAAASQSTPATTTPAPSAPSACCSPLHAAIHHFLQPCSRPSCGLHPASAVMAAWHAPLLALPALCCGLLFAAAELPLLLSPAKLRSTKSAIPQNLCKYLYCPHRVSLYCPQERGRHERVFPDARLAARV